MLDPQKLSRIFKVLSVDTRVRIVQLLKGKALCVNALAAQLEITPAAVSQHLRVLRDFDLIVPEKRGYYVHYSLNDKTLAEWREMTDGLLGMDKGGSGECSPGRIKRYHRDAKDQP